MSGVPDTEVLLQPLEHLFKCFNDPLQDLIVCTCDTIRTLLVRREGLSSQIAKLEGHLTAGTLPTSLSKQTYKIWVSKDVEEDEEIVKIKEDEQKRSSEANKLRLQSIVDAKKREKHLVNERCKTIVQEFKESSQRTVDFEADTLSNFGIQQVEVVEVNNLIQVIEKFIVAVVAKIKDNETSKQLLLSKKRNREDEKKLALSKLEDNKTIKELVHLEMSKYNKHQKNLPGRLTKSPMSTQQTKKRYQTKH